MPGTVSCMVSFLFPFTMVLRLLFPFFIAALLPVPAAAAAAQVPPFIAPDHVTLAMLRVANVRPQDYLIDLGSGDGRLVIVAAKRFGAQALGIESVPELVRASRENAGAASIAHKAVFREQAISETDLSQASVVILHPQPAMNLQLLPALLKLAPGTRIVSQDQDLGAWRPDRVLTVAAVDKPGGQTRLSRVFLWTVPAQAAGEWCGRGKFTGVQLRIAQSFQDVEGRLQHEGRAYVFSGSFHSTSIQSRKGFGGRADFELDGPSLLLKRGSGAFKSFSGAKFMRAGNGTC